MMSLFLYIALFTTTTHKAVTPFTGPQPGNKAGKVMPSTSLSNTKPCFDFPWSRSQIWGTGRDTWSHSMTTATLPRRPDSGLCVSGMSSGSSTTFLTAMESVGVLSCCLMETDHCCDQCFTGAPYLGRNIFSMHVYKRTDMDHQCPEPQETVQRFKLHLNPCDSTVHVIPQAISQTCLSPWKPS